MLANALNAYQSASQSSMSGREVEGAALTKAALKLRQCKHGWDDRGSDFKLNEALKYNQMIWSIFQSELVDDDNPLPRKLKQNLLSLGAFVDRQILDIMAFPEPQKLNILIEINQNLAAGLRGEML